MKKINKALVLFMAMLMLVSVTACGNDAVKETDKDANQEQNVDVSSTDDNKEPDNTGDTQNVPDTSDDSNAGGAVVEKDTRTPQECAAIVLKAYKELDLETLAPFLSEDSYEQAEAVFSYIKSNPEDKAFWDNTIGSAIYFEESDVLLVKSVDYIEARWYGDAAENNEAIPEEESEDFSVAYLDAIYNNYYADAPYEVAYKVSDTIISVKDEGNNKAVFNKIPYVLGCEKLKYVFSSYSYYTREKLRAAILLNAADCFALGFDYIAKDIPDYKDLLSKDLDKFVAILDETAEEDPSGIYYHAYTHYIKDENNRALLQKFFDEECIVLRDLSSITLFLPIDLNSTYVYKRQVKENDKATITSMGIKLVTKHNVFSFPDMGNNFSAYYDLTERAVERGIIEKVSYF